jgi:hypothetical protein
MNEELSGLPRNSKTLVDHLERIHPEECVREGESWENAVRRAGRRDVVRYLIHLRDHDRSTVEDILRDNL